MAAIRPLSVAQPFRFANPPGHYRRHHAQGPKPERRLDRQGEVKADPDPEQDRQPQHPAAAFPDQVLEGGVNEGG
jgi:hypothetical protein